MIMHTALTTLADICQAAIIPINITGYVPQWLMMIRNRSSSNVSLRSYILWIFSTSLTLFYAVTQFLIYGTGGMLLITSCLSLVLLGVTCTLISMYRPRPNDSAGGTRDKAQHVDSIPQVPMSFVSKDRAPPLST